MELWSRKIERTLNASGTVTKEEVFGYDEWAGRDQ